MQQSDFVALRSKPERIAKRLYCEFSFTTKDGLGVVWNPAPPKAPIPRRVWNKYTERRGEFLERVGKATGGNVLLIEADDAIEIGRMLAEEDGSDD